MDAKISYSDLLTDILEKDRSKCICPKSYFGNLKKLKHSAEDLCHFEANDEFGSRCLFSRTYQGTSDVNLSKGYSQCICDARMKKSILPKHNSARADTVVKPNCSCVGTCLCRSEESILKRIPLNSQVDCNRAKCICSTCLCQNANKLKDLFPQPFRNNIKRGGFKLMTDEIMKKECDEIKQIINDYEKIEMNKPTKISIKNKKSKTISQSNDHIPILPGSSKGRNKSSVVSSKRSSTSSKKSVHAISYINEVKSQKINEKKESIQKKGTSSPNHKKTYLKNYLKKPITDRRKPTLKKRSLQVRYYYLGGGTDRYGVKIGHKKCMPKPELVPKNMGWLWSYEDPTKGIRERKGWPPGFIGKSITNMIQELKNYESNLVNEDKPLEPKRWLTYPSVVTENKDPKEELPLLHIHKKGRTYNITFCPKNSDDDIGPIPIPLTIKASKQDGDSETSDSTLEFEFHSPKPRLKSDVPVAVPAIEESSFKPSPLSSVPEPSNVPPPSSIQEKKQRKRKLNKSRSLGSEENKILWEEQPTHIQNIA